MDFTGKVAIVTGGQMVSVAKSCAVSLTAAVL